MTTTHIKVPWLVRLRFFWCVSCMRRSQLLVSRSENCLIALFISSSFISPLFFFLRTENMHGKYNIEAEGARSSAPLLVLNSSITTKLSDEPAPKRFEDVTVPVMDKIPLTAKARGPAPITPFPWFFNGRCVLPPFLPPPPT